MTRIQTSATGRSLCTECGTAPIDTYRGQPVDGVPYCFECREGFYLENDHMDGNHANAYNENCPMCEGDAEQAEIDEFPLAQYSTEDLLAEIARRVK